MEEQQGKEIGKGRRSERVRDGRDGEAVAGNGAGGPQ